MRNSLLVLLFVFAIAKFSTAQTTYVHCGNLLDVESGKMQTEATIVIVAGKIIEVLQGYSNPPENAALIDLKTNYVLPGLIDMHVHLEGEFDEDYMLNQFTKNPADRAFQAVNYARITLMLGFTTVRDLGGSGVNISLRKAIAAGTTVGPRVFTAGKAIAITGGHADPTNGYSEALMGDPGPKEGVANGPVSGQKAVRQRYKNGADLIKITATGGVLSVAKDGLGPHFTEEEMTIICSTAKDLGLKVAAHAHGDEGMQRAIRAGVASIEHGTFMSEATMELMKERGTYLVPTLTAGASVADSAKKAGFFPDIVTPKALLVGPQIQNTFAKAYKKGVKIAFGTDAGVFSHGKNSLEFRYMKQGGMPELEIIRAATINAADLLGASEELGTIAKGKWADIVAVDENPLEDIETMLNVTFVMKEGVVYKRN